MSVLHEVRQEILQQNYGVSSASFSVKREGYKESHGFPVLVSYFLIIQGERISWVKHGIPVMRPCIR